MPRVLSAIKFLSVKVSSYKKVNMDGKVIIQTENVPIRWKGRREGVRGEDWAGEGRRGRRKEGRRGRGDWWKEGPRVLNYPKLRNVAHNGDE